MTDFLDLSIMFATGLANSECNLPFTFHVSKLSYKCDISWKCCCSSALWQKVVKLRKEMYLYCIEIEILVSILPILCSDGRDIFEIAA